MYDHVHSKGNLHMPTVTQVVSTASPVIAALSLFLNIYLAYLLRNARTNVSRNDDMRTRLYNLKHKLDETSLLTTAPHYEMWEYGFKSLEELREVAVKSYGQLEIAPDGRVPRELKTAVKQIFDGIKELYRYRDSYRLFLKDDNNLPYEIDKWNDFERAKHALSVLQADYRKNITIIDKYLTNLY